MAISRFDRADNVTSAARTARQITFSLSDAQYAANDRSGIMVGLPLTVQLDAGLLMMGRDSGVEWFERTSPDRPLLQQVALDRCVFRGRVTDIALWESPEGAACQMLLDCGLPLRVDVVEVEQEAAVNATPYGLQEDDWLLGLAFLEGVVALQPSDLLWQPLHGTIVDIQRLILSPHHPDFGKLRWLHSLPSASFLPDQVFVTVRW